MKKEENRLLVTVRLTESQIKNVGGNRWMKRKSKSLFALAVLCLAWMFITSAVLKAGYLNSIVTVAPSVISLFGWTWKFNQAGKNLWNKVRKLPEPIDLDSVK